MEAEKLKLLAEALGYETRMVQNSLNQLQSMVTIKQNRRYGDYAEFDPESNPAQREEVLLWLMKHHNVMMGEFSDGEGYSIFLWNKGQSFFDCPLNQSTGKDYTTALMMAAERELG